MGGVFAVVVNSPPVTEAPDSTDLYVLLREQPSGTGEPTQVK